MHLAQEEHCANWLGHHDVITSWHCTLCYTQSWCINGPSCKWEVTEHLSQSLIFVLECKSVATAPSPSADLSREKKIAYASYKSDVFLSLPLVKHWREISKQHRLLWFPAHYRCHFPEATGLCCESWTGQCNSCSRLTEWAWVTLNLLQHHFETFTLTRDHKLQGLFKVWPKSSQFELGVFM